VGGRKKKKKKKKSQKTLLRGGGGGENIDGLGKRGDSKKKEGGYAETRVRFLGGASWSGVEGAWLCSWWESEGIGGVLAGEGNN